MKKLIMVYASLLLIISISSCQEDIYLDEYSDYRTVVEKYSKEFSRANIDSIRRMVTTLNSHSRLLSCVYCVEEGILEGEILDYCRNNHKALLFIADSYFRGEEGALKYTFQTLFKEFYPPEYDLLLKEDASPKPNHWRDIDREYSLPMGKLFEKYIEIEFEKK